MASQNILTIDISNIDFNSTKFKMVGGLTLDKVKIKYNWIFNANIKDAIIGEDENGLVWYSGTWINGTWENGTWYSGTFLDGRWKDGNVYSYDIDTKQLFNGNYYINKVDISKTHFVKCSFEGGTFNYGIFGNIKNINDITLPYVIDRDFILNNIEDYEIDNGFNVGCGIGFTMSDDLDNYVKTTVFDSDNKIIIGGQFSNYNNVKSNSIIRLNYDGTYDYNFDGGVEYGGIVNSIVIDSNNKILVGGNFNTYNNTIQNGILRLNDDGSIDSSFISGEGFNSGTVNTICIDSNNKILIGGDFQKYNNIETYTGIKIIDGIKTVVTNYVSNIIRLNSDGSIDDTFNIITGLNGIVNIIKLDSNNKILVGGEFTEINGITHNGIIRLNNDGSVDSTFIGTGFNGGVKTIDIDSDGNIFVGGDFTEYVYNYITIECNKIIKITTTGTYDDSPFTKFNIGTGFMYDSGTTSYVNSIKIDGNNKILVGGYFDTYKNIFCYGIVRLNSDGSIDNTFYSESGTFNNNVNDVGSINTITVDFRNKILVGGYFDIYNQTNINLLMRLNSNGVLDNINNKIFYVSDINKAIFKSGTFVNGLFNSAVFKNGTFMNGYFNNSIWFNGNWYNGEFLGGEWYNGEFLGGDFSNGNWYGGSLSKIGDNKTNFGLNYKNKKSNAANWYNGDFSNGTFYSIYYRELDITESLIVGTDIIEETRDDLVNWYNGNFRSGEFRGGTIHNCIWDNGIIYNGTIIYITFNNGHIFDVVCYGGVFNNGSISGGIYDDVTINNMWFGYDLF